VHRRAVLGDRDGEHGVRLARGEQPLGERLDARWRGALADPDREHALRQDEHIPSLEPGVVLRVAAIQERRAGEARVVAVDRRGDRRLAAPCLHGQGGDRHSGAQPDARVPCEEQVGERRDDEVLRRGHPLDEPVTVRAELLAGQAGHQHLG
jgi:hypothetical protein